MTTVTNPAQSKFQVVTETALPHKCISCNRDADGKTQFIDFALSLDYEGAIYICVPCGEEIAHTLGFVTESVLTTAALDQSELEQQLEKANEDVRNLNEQLASYRDVLDSIPDVDRVNAVLSKIQDLGDKLVKESESRLVEQSTGKRP